MKLLVNGREVPILSIMSQESLEQFYNCYIVVVPLRLNTDRVKLVMKSEESFRILREEYHSSSYAYTIVCEETYKLLNSVFPAFSGYATLVQLLQKLGIKNNISLDTGRQYWRIPALSLVGLLNHLSMYSVPSRGGAPFFNLNLEGLLELVDLRNVLSRENPKVAKSLGIESDDSYRDWMLKTPGQLRITVGSPKKIETVDFVIESGHGKGICLLNDSTGHELDLLKRALTSNYYTNKYTSRRIVTSQSVDAFGVGDLVKIDNCVLAVVYSRSVSLPLADEAAQVSYTFVTEA